MLSPDVSRAMRLTAGASSTHNRHVFARLCRALLVVALAPWLAGAAAWPVEHVHEGDANHHQAAAHRHVEAHEVAAHEFAAHDHDEIEGAHDDQRVVWLTSASLHQRPYHLAIDWAVVTLTRVALLDSSQWVAAPLYDASPPHAPPRTARSPRAPPSFHI